MKKINLAITLILIINSNTFSQWLQSGGPNGGYTDEIVKIGSSLFVSTGNGGIYKSTNNGETWTLKKSGLPHNEGVQDLVEHNGLLYASMSRDGIYLSIDEGENWTPINSGIDQLTFYNIAVNELNIYAGNANGGIYHSSDNGENWIEKSTGVSDIQFQDFAFFKSTIYAGGSSLFKSSNSGDTWEIIEVVGLGLNSVRSMVATDSTLYISSDIGEVFTSPDGINWNKSTLNTGSTIASMGVSADSVYLTTSAGKIYYTKNEALNWTLIQNTETTDLANSIYLLNGKIIMSTSKGLYTSGDGGTTWVESNNGINALQIESLVSNDSLIFAGTDIQGIHRSDLNGNWVKINSGLDGFNATSVNDIIILDNHLYIGTGGGVYSSSNYGDSWVRMFDPGLNKSIQALDYDNGVFIAGVNGSGVYISTDTTKVWSLTNTTGLNIETSYECIRVKGDTIAVSTQSGEIFVSEDLGSSWTDISITGGYYFTQNIQFANNKLYAGTTKGLLISEDLGQNWTFFNNEVKSIKSFEVVNDKVYAATSEGIFVTSDSRNVWYDVSEGLGNQYVNEIIISNDTIYAGTFASSVWERSILEANIPPLIIEAAGVLSTPEDNEFILQLTDLVIDDDNYLPDNFTLTVTTNDNYIIKNDTIIPNQNFNGNLTIPVSVNDGIDDSPIFNISIEVTPVNDAPIITGQLNSLSTISETEIAILLEHLIVEDVDNSFPSDFLIKVSDSIDYNISSNIVTPIKRFIGTLNVPVKVNDGELDSEEFIITIDVSEILGLEYSLQENFSIYPNPVNDRLNISSNILIDSFQINILNLNGKLVYSTNTVNNKTLSINLSSIPKGIYILQIISENQVGSLKLLKE